jgi:hypothetical protein
MPTAPGRTSRSSSAGCPMSYLPGHSPIAQSCDRPSCASTWSTPGDTSRSAAAHWSTKSVISRRPRCAGRRAGSRRCAGQATRLTWGGAPALRHATRQVCVAAKVGTTGIAHANRVGKDGCHGEISVYGRSAVDRTRSAHSRWKRSASPSPSGFSPGPAGALQGRQTTPTRPGPEERGRP